ncbi:MAG: SCO family protein [Alphaproteobacteria bacterium]|nr:SCO family protein [Alphaproteobacteria bacterium]
MIRKFLSSVAVALGLLACGTAFADEREDKAITTSLEVIGRTMPDLSFQGVDGKTLSLTQLRGKPVLLTLIYTGCADVCPAVIESLAPAVAVGEDALGKGSFNVVTIGFDTRNDTPVRMRSFARDHNAGGDNWFFLASDQKTMDRLSEAVGFSYFSYAGGFDHMAQVTVIDKTGKIYRQVYGSSFDPPQIVDPLKDLIFGREKPFFTFEGLADRVKLFCTVYNPNTGRYYFNYSLFASIVIGAASLGLVLVVLIRETRKSMRSHEA